MKNFFRFNYPALLWAILILVLTGLPGGSFPKLDFWSLLSFDKFAHAFFFALLSFSIAMGQYKQHRFCSLRFRCARRAVLIGIVYGIFLELLQEYVWVDRYADLLDVIANTIGSVLGVLYFRLAFREQMNFK